MQVTISSFSKNENDTRHTSWTSFSFLFLVNLFISFHPKHTSQVATSLISAVSLVFVETLSKLLLVLIDALLSDTFCRSTQMMSSLGTSRSTF